MTSESIHERRPARLSLRVTQTGSESQNLDKKSMCQLPLNPSRPRVAFLRRLEHAILKPVGVFCSERWSGVPIRLGHWHRASVVGFALAILGSL